METVFRLCGLWSWERTTSKGGLCILQSGAVGKTCRLDDGQNGR